MIKVLIADNQPVVRLGLKQILRTALDYEITDEAKSEEEIIAKSLTGDFNVVIFDLNLCEKAGLQIVKELKKKKPKLSLLVFSTIPEEQFAIRALRSGASGYVTKNCAPDELISALKKVTTGGKYISSTLAQKLAFNRDNGSHKTLHESLSNREYQILCMLGSGKSVSDIAHDLALSVKTVSTHRSRLLRKMKLKNNAEITHYVIKNELISMSNN